MNKQLPESKTNHSTETDKSVDLKDIRSQISELDQSLLALLAKRRSFSLAVAKSKENSQKPIRDQQREQELLELLIEKGASKGLDAHYVTRLFHAIIEDSLAVQREYLQAKSNPAEKSQALVSVAVLGGRGAYSYLAAKKHFGGQETPAEGIKQARGFNYIGCSTFEKVLKSVEHGKADFGVIPIENTTSGGITEVYDLLLDANLSVIGEEKYPINHCLVANQNTRLEDIEKVHAHPEASRQCNKNLPRLISAEVSLVSSTAEALQLAAEDSTGNVAAIASKTSADEFGLKVLLSDIANLKENTTRFLVVARQPRLVSAQIPCKTSIALSTGQKPGALAEVLLAFRDANIPLSKLESRPIAGKPWEQMFYIDLLANVSDLSVKQALENTSRLCRFVKVLGCYPSTETQATKVSSGALSRARQGQSLSADDHSAAAIVKAVAPSPEARKSYHLASREHKPENTVIQVKDVNIGGDGFVVIGGPCAVESAEQINACAKLARNAGAAILRGGCFKPRTSPYSFQGMGFEGLGLLAAAGRSYQLPIITEVMNSEDVRQVAESADILQIGARNMQNFGLLKAVGQVNRPVMLKRGLMASIDELLNAAEYILSQGNMQVFLCERGIRTFETATRNTLDLSAVPLLKQLTHLPILVDPSHAVGQRELVLPMAKAAKAVGAHGVMIEFHPDPDSALSDGPQALHPEQFSQLLRELHG